MVRLLALGAVFFFLSTAFRAGWRRAETDFPNYYTAAVLVRKGEPLRKYYDWTWFARQMNYAGSELRLGAYNPFTPLTMLPMVGFAQYPVQRAKQLWLVCNLVFLAASVWMLSQLTRFRMDQIWLLAFCGFYSLYKNFLFGQYYVFLLFLLTLTFYSLHRRRPISAGFVAGAAFALKLYAGPFLLYFVAKRRWKTVAGMIAAIIGAGVLAIAMFGWPDIRYYLVQILPRSLEAGCVDPYNAGNPTLSTLLRRWFVREPQLNPDPLWDAPWLFFFMRTFVSLAIVVFAFLGLMMRPTTDRRDFAWFLVAVLLLSTNVAPYTFILLLLPIALLLHDAKPWPAFYLVASYVLLTFPLRPAWLFPKVWLLLALFLAVGWKYWRGLSSKLMMCAAALVLGFALLDAKTHMYSYEQEPEQHFTQIPPGSRSVFSSFPAITRAGLFFQSMGADRWVVRRLHDGQSEEISLPGHALRPMALHDGAISIELVAHGTSQMVRFDPATKTVDPIPMSVPINDTESALSPDGKWLAFTSEDTGAKHLWLRSVASGQRMLLTGGNCNSSWPAWQADSRSLVFASDCGRAFGLPALYLAQPPKWPSELPKEERLPLK